MFPARSDLNLPSTQPTFKPSASPSHQPSFSPSYRPSVRPSATPSSGPSSPTEQPLKFALGTNISSHRVTQPAHFPAKCRTHHAVCQSHTRSVRGTKRDTNRLAQRVANLHPTAEPTHVTFEPTHYPEVRPTIAPSTTVFPTVDSAVIIYVESGQSLTRNHIFVNYIVNTSGAVDIRGSEGRVVFTVLPQTASGLRIEHFNV
eukprot:gene37608-46398_t